MSPTPPEKVTLLRPKQRPTWYVRLVCDHHIMLNLPVWQDEALYCPKCKQQMAVATCRQIPWPEPK